MATAAARPMGIAGIAGIALAVITIAGCRDKSDEPKRAAEPETASGTLPPDDPAGPAGPSGPADPGRASGAAPHPDYPTPLAAGTDKIFTLEEPDRGPLPPTTLDIQPLLRGVTWTTHARCQADSVDMICSKRATPPNWRVGRRGKEVVIAIPKSPAFDTHVYLAKPDGTPLKYFEIGPRKRVAKGRFYQADRYTSREPSGVNALRGCGFLAFTLDAKRHSEKLRCLQWSGDPMRDTNGVAAIRYKRDAQGFITETHYEGLDGKPAVSVDGYASKRFEMDDIGRDLVVTYFDVAGAPSAANNDCFGHRYEYHSTNVITKATCLDASGKPMAAATGITTTATRVDARGCNLGVEFTDRHGAAATDDLKIHRTELKADAFCDEIERKCFDITNELAACSHEGPAKLVTKRDAHGNPISVKHYDTSGEPGGDESYGIFELRNTFDDRGRQVGEACHDEKGEPIDCGTTGLHVTRSKFDDAGRIVEERFYSPTGAPTTNVATSIRRYLYDNYDHQFEETNFDERGEIVDTRRDLWDANHRAFAVLMLDGKGAPMNYEGCYTASTCPYEWHAVRIVRRSDGVVMENKFFDKDGQVIETMNCREVPCFD